MNIILMTSARDTSGGTRQALYLAQGFRAAGHQVRFFTYPESSLRALDRDINWQDLPVGWIAAERRLRDTIIEMSSATENSGPVILHAFHNKAVKMAAYYGTWWRLLKLPVACVAHRGVIYRPYNFLPYTLPGIRAFIVNSQACADTLPLLWRKKRSSIVYNSIPPERLTPSLTPQKVLENLAIPFERGYELPVVIGTVANDKPNKGVEVLIRAFAKMIATKKIMQGEHPLPFLTVIGVRSHWMELCEELGVAKLVRLVPRTEQIADFLQTFKLFVIPSFLESQPNTLIEAMGMKVAALGSKVGGIPELLNNNEALLFTPGNIDELAEKLGALLANPSKLEQEAAINLEKSKEFLPEYRIKRVLDIYEMVLKERK